MSITRDPVTQENMGIQCDSPGCMIMAPDNSTLMKHMGLVNMGWQCTGGRHWCPDHKDANDGQIHSER